MRRLYTGQTLEMIAKDAIPNLGPTSRVICVGFGASMLIPDLQVYH
jgi:hypothetical protein